MYPPPSNYAPSQLTQSQYAGSIEGDKRTISTSSTSDSTSEKRDRRNRRKGRGIKRKQSRQLKEEMRENDDDEIL